MSNFKTVSHQYAFDPSSLIRITNFKESFFKFKGSRLFLEAFTSENVQLLIQVFPL